jgi:hypothetical protein
LLGYHFLSIGFGEFRIGLIQAQKIDTSMHTIAKQESSVFVMLLITLPFKAHTKPFPQHHTGRLLPEPFVALPQQASAKPISEEMLRGTTHLLFTLSLALKT